jgi:hypothetical protein
MIPKGAKRRATKVNDRKAAVLHPRCDVSMWFGNRLLSRRNKRGVCMPVFALSMKFAFSLHKAKIFRRIRILREIHGPQFAARGVM